MIGIAGCCARPASGHVAVPPSNVMNSRRLNRCSCIGPVSPGQDCRIPILRRSVSGEVRSTSVSGSNPGSQAFPGGAKSGREQVQQDRYLLDDLVGASEEGGWNIETERLRSLDVNHQLILVRRLHWQIGRFLALEDAIYITGGISV